MTRKILLCNHEFTISGASRMLLTLGELLLAEGHEVHVAPLLQTPGPMREQFVAAGMPVVEQADLLSYDLAVVNSVCSGDVITPLSEYVPVLWWIHEAELARGNIMLSRWLQDGVLGKVAGFVFQSEYQKEVLNSFIYDSGRPYHVVPNCLPRTLPSEPKPRDPARFRIVSLGGVEVRKRHEDTIRACELLPESLKAQIEVVIVGRTLSSRPFDGATQAIVDAHPDRYKLTGELAAEEAQSWLRSADLFVLASSSETQGLAVFEAMRDGIPCLLSDLPTYRHFGLQHGRHALFHAVGDVELLAEHIAMLMRNEGLRGRLSDNGPPTAAPYVGSAAFKYKFLSVIEQHARRPAA